MRLSLRHAELSRHAVSVGCLNCSDVQPFPTSKKRLYYTKSMTFTPDRPLRVLVVGSGPSGVFAADALIRQTEVGRG